jgi:hypothetical protein
LEINLFSRTVAGIGTGQATLNQVGDGAGHGLPVAWFFVTASCMLLSARRRFKETAGNDWLFL